MNEKLTTLSYVCRDYKGRIVHSTDRMIGDVLVLITEAITIREALRVAAQRNMDNLPLESGS